MAVGISNLPSVAASKVTIIYSPGPSVNRRVGLSSSPAAGKASLARAAFSWLLTLERVSSLNLLRSASDSRLN
jgi:hypothetical protein